MLLTQDHSPEKSNSSVALIKSKVLKIEYLGSLSDIDYPHVSLYIGPSDKHQTYGIKVLGEVLGTLIVSYGEELLRLFIERDYDFDRAYGVSPLAINFYERGIAFERDNRDGTRVACPVYLNEGIALILEAFLTYYWFLKSAPEKYRPKWYDQLAGDLREHYPQEFEEYDRKPLVDI